MLRKLYIFLGLAIFVRNQEYFIGDMFLAEIKNAKNYVIGIVRVKENNSKNIIRNCVIELKNLNYLNKLCDHLGYDSFFSFAKVERTGLQKLDYAKVELTRNWTCCILYEFSNLSKNFPF